MNARPSKIIAAALSVLWLFIIASILVSGAAELTDMDLDDLGAFVAGAIAPPLLLWLVVNTLLGRAEYRRRFDELLLQQDELSLQLRLLQGSLPKSNGESTHPGGTQQQPAISGTTRIQVEEGEEVGPEFILRNAETIDEWIELEFRNVGGPASNLVAITEGDTDTRVTPDSVGSWKSVRVALAPQETVNDPFRFCLNFNNSRGEEQQQFFRYSREGVVGIARPVAD